MSGMMRLSCLELSLIFLIWKSVPDSFKRVIYFKHLLILNMFKRIEKTVKVKNKQGLHARPAALFVQIANKYDSSIKVLKEDQVVNGKSIMGILMLAAEKDSEVIIIAEGNDSEEAIIALEGILNSDE